MDAQGYYDLLVVSAQDGTLPAINSSGFCRYRLGDKRCAFGLLIPDEDYGPWMEDASPAARLGELAEKRGKPGYWLPDWVPDFGVTGVGPAERYRLILDAIGRVQNCHDNNATDWSVKQFVRSLNDLACFQGVAKVDPSTLSIAS